MATLSAKSKCKCGNSYDYPSYKNFGKCKACSEKAGYEMFIFSLSYGLRAFFVRNVKKKLVVVDCSANDYHGTLSNEITSSDIDWCSKELCNWYKQEQSDVTYIDQDRKEKCQYIYNISERAYSLNNVTAMPEIVT